MYCMLLSQGSICIEINVHGLCFTSFSLILQIHFLYALRKANNSLAPPPLYYPKRRQRLMVIGESGHIFRFTHVLDMFNKQLDISLALPDHWITRLVVSKTTGSQEFSTLGSHDFEYYRVDHQNS